MDHVVRDLLLAPSVRLGDGAAHGIGDPVSVHDRRTIDMARGPPDGLNQRAFGTQEALLVRVEYRHQRYLRDIQAFAQQVDADQYVEFTEAQVADDLHPFHRINIRMQVAHLYAVL